MTIEISKKEYFQLRLASITLTLLQCGGVDNWDWYGDSLHPEDGDSLDTIEDELRAEIFGDKGEE